MREISVNIDAFKNEPEALFSPSKDLYFSFASRSQERRRYLSSGFSCESDSQHRRLEEKI